MECLRCQSEMELGFVGDATHNHYVRWIRAPVWYAGPLEWSFWGGLKLSKRRQIFVQTMRCVGCGYLESYAPEPPPRG